MPFRILALAPLAALTLAALAKAPEQPGCRGKVTGSVTASFTCRAGVARTEDGKPVFVITPTQEIPNVPAYRPAAFELPGAPAVRTYTLDDLGMGMASLAAEGGTLYTATKTSSQRGEVTLTLRSVTDGSGPPGTWVVHGTYRARLVPAGGGKTGEVVFDVAF